MVRLGEKVVQFVILHQLSRKKNESTRENHHGRDRQDKEEEEVADDNFFCSSFKSFG